MSAMTGLSIATPDCEQVCTIVPGQRVKKLDPQQASQMPKLVSSVCEHGL